MKEIVEKIKDLLVDKLDCVYCHNCKFEDDDTHCEECHRKNMNWSLSEYSAEQLAEKIVYDIIKYDKE